MASIMDYLFKTSKQREAERLEREEIERFKIENPGVPPPLTEAEKAQLQRDEENRRLNEAVLLSREENERAKEEALIACNELHEVVMQCYKNGGPFNWCMEESNAFWDCYKRERGFARTKLGAQLGQILLPQPQGDKRDTSQ